MYSTSLTHAIDIYIKSAVTLYALNKETETRLKQNTQMRNNNNVSNKQHPKRNISTTTTTTIPITYSLLRLLLTQRRRQPNPINSPGIGNAAILPILVNNEILPVRVDEEPD